MVHRYLNDQPRKRIFNERRKNKNSSLQSITDGLNLMPPKKIGIMLPSTPLYTHMNMSNK